MGLLTTGAGAGGGGLPPTTSTTWNPADKNANIALSGGNLVATSTAGGGFHSLRSVNSHSAGKYYWEISVGTITTTVASVIGIANASMSLADGSYVGGNANSAGWSDGDGKITTNGGYLTSMNGVTYSSGDTVCVALDLTNNKLWMRKAGGLWMGDGLANPATNVGGADISGLSGPFFAADTVFDTTAAHTANFGGSAFAYTPPAGFGNLA